MNPIWLLRMAKWLRHPPSPGRVKLVLAVVAICLLLVAIERLIGWPDALSTDPVRRPMRP
ncbi:hypothetical protein GCM10011415_27160 [Salipiger pallidus]|uniref:Uncharacterized protein n=1 Tax=Salipiger pallidus TaxID=1775170 RepID=A0A8J3EH86_9RHOB|nr:hypothetical protein [Salipiger pallidus]GGG76905.1 hypothetical protein GCM10011415_27160 [Salipiger pallidus]